jgi:hypothetical protein
MSIEYFKKTTVFITVFVFYSYTLSDLVMICHPSFAPLDFIMQSILMTAVLVLLCSRFMNFLTTACPLSPSPTSSVSSASKSTVSLCSLMLS